MQRANDTDKLMASIAELIIRARSGDEAALEQIIRAYQERVAAMVISRLGNAEDWQDVCQQTFVKMVLGLRRLKEIDAFEPWLFRIARNACFDHLRRRRSRWFLVPWQDRHEDHHEDQAEDGHQAIAEGGQDTDPRSSALDTAIERLPSEQRELMELVRDHSWGYARLAAVTGHSVGAIKSRLFRARRRLKQLVIETGLER